MIGTARRAAALATVLLAAKALTVVLRATRVPGSPIDLTPAGWALPIAIDLWVVLAFAAADGASQIAARRPPRVRAAAARAAWAAYAALAAYTALNVPVAATLGTPLTWPMLAAAGTTLADSIAMYVSPANVASIAAVIGLAWWAPRRLAAIGAVASWRLAVLGAVALGAAVAGTTFGGRLGDFGVRRNAVFALAVTAQRVRSSTAGVADRPSDRLKAASPDGGAADLTALAGTAAGHNVVWIVLESAGARYLGSYGADVDPMPNVTALAERGVVFENAYTVVPESVKGLFSLLCSAEPAPYTDAADYAADRVPCRAIASVLRDAGYATGLFHSGRFVYLGMDAMVADRGFDVVADAAAIGGAHASSFGVDEASTVARMLDQLDAWSSAAPNGAARRPFFLMYLPIAGHHPYAAPGDAARPYDEREELGRYRNDLFVADQAIGALVDGLRVRGEMSRTLVIIVGDHGEAFHQHPGNFAHSLYLYEENVHVPLIVAPPGSVPPGLSRRAPQVASVIDVAPTLLDLLGLRRPPGYRGRSLLEPTPGIARFYTDHTTWQMGLRTGRWKYIVDVDNNPFGGQLFDLGADPLERRDVAEQHVEMAWELGADVRGWAQARRAAVSAGDRVR